MTREVTLAGMPAVMLLAAAVANGTALRLAGGERRTLWLSATVREDADG